MATVEEQEIQNLRRLLDAAREVSRANARLAEDRRVAILATMDHLSEIAETLRVTARGLREAARGENTETAVNPWHAANRLERIAREIGGGGSVTTKPDKANGHRFTVEEAELIADGLRQACTMSPEDLATLTAKVRAIAGDGAV